MKAGNPRRVAVFVETTWTTYGGSAQQLIELGAVEFVGAQSTGRGLHHFVAATRRAAIGGDDENRSVIGVSE